MSRDIVRSEAVLLPDKGKIDFDKWAIIACDQHTSNRAYWERVEKYVGDLKSTLRLILPEVYLEDEDKDTKIKKVNVEMEKYIQEVGFFKEIKKPIYIERLVEGQTRKGLVVAVDLEKYNYKNPGVYAIRPTEATIEDRIVPRLVIRKDAPLELPHIICLLNDPEKTVIEKIDKGKLELLYDIELNEEGGKLLGYALNDEMEKNVFDAMDKLLSLEMQEKFYGEAGKKNPLLLAVGDGNHSLATALRHWQITKETLKEEEQKNHPARFALVEIENIHDDGVKFEPIHRLFMALPPEKLLNHLKEEYGDKMVLKKIENGDELIKLVTEKKKSGERHKIGFIRKGEYIMLEFEGVKTDLIISDLQPRIDKLKLPSSEVDYIHGDKELIEKASESDTTCGILLPPMEKGDLFPTVVDRGAVPRKTFSLGHAHEKRYYVECRKIK